MGKNFFNGFLLGALSWMALSAGSLTASEPVMASNESLDEKLQLAYYYYDYNWKGFHYRYYYYPREHRYYSRYWRT